jgi:hypothetical protein
MISSHASFCRLRDSGFRWAPGAPPPVRFPLRRPVPTHGLQISRSAFVVPACCLVSPSRQVLSSGSRSARQSQFPAPDFWAAEDFILWDGLPPKIYLSCSWFTWLCWSTPGFVPVATSSRPGAIPARDFVQVSCAPKLRLLSSILHWRVASSFCCQCSSFVLVSLARSASRFLKNLLALCVLSKVRFDSRVGVKFLFCWDLQGTDLACSLVSELFLCRVPV